MIERQANPASQVDTTSNAPSILAINGFLMSFALVTVLARIHVRTFMLKTVGADDYVSKYFPEQSLSCFCVFMDFTRNVHSTESVFGVDSP